MITDNGEVFGIATNYDSGVKLVLKFINKVFPEVDREIDYWSGICNGTESNILINQALASIKHKKFHAQGGSIFALYPNVDFNKAVKFIVSLQTISDYLDNLCDRAGVFDEKAFLQLHLSMMDAVDPSGTLHNYYELYPYKDDNEYLTMLVETCRLQVKELPSFSLVADYIKRYIKLYSEMQSYKHIPLESREARLKEWADRHLYFYPGISCWEFSAAAGSTLGVFVLFAAASNPYLTAQEVILIDEAYFPWISGLHILLDYYIDSREDMQTGDLNFTYYYENLKQCEERLLFFAEHSLEYCNQLPYPKFHATIIKGLLSMYLSDPKASVGLNRITSKRIISGKGLDTMFYYNLCRFLRTVNKL